MTLNEYRQVWAGNTDLNGMLRCIGGWQVGCEHHIKALEAVSHADKQGWLGRRTHYAPAMPEGVEAFQLTDSGLETLKAWGGNAEAAREMRDWFQSRSASKVIQ